MDVVSLVQYLMYQSLLLCNADYSHHNSLRFICTFWLTLWKALFQGVLLVAGKIWSHHPPLKPRVSFILQDSPQINSLQGEWGLVIFSIKISIYKVLFVQVVWNHLGTKWTDSKQVMGRIAFEVLICECHPEQTYGHGMLWNLLPPLLDPPLNHFIFFKECKLPSVWWLCMQLYSCDSLFKQQL